jgi:hypothetical protein
MRTRSQLDPVRLALPRSPESGVAVSTHVKILSREKRKMWLTFSHHDLFVVVLFPKLFVFIALQK